MLVGTCAVAGSALLKIERFRADSCSRAAMSIPPPENGQRILIFKNVRLIEQILTKEKSMEIRGTHYKPGRWLLGCKGIVHGSARFGPAVLIESPLQFERYRPRHLWAFPLGVFDKLPYKTTYGFPIDHVQKMNLPFSHRPGAVSVVRYRKP